MLDMDTRQLHYAQLHTLRCGPLYCVLAHTLKRWRKPLDKAGFVTMAQRERNEDEGVLCRERVHCGCEGVVFPRSVQHVRRDERLKAGRLCCRQLGQVRALAPSQWLHADGRAADDLLIQRHIVGEASESRALLPLAASLDGHDGVRIGEHDVGCSASRGGQPHGPRACPKLEHSPTGDESAPLLDVLDQMRRTLPHAEARQVADATIAPGTRCFQRHGVIVEAGEAAAG